jgi:hypothetical protein
MVRPGGLELPTFWFVARRSIQLSYGRAVQKYYHSGAPLIHPRQNWPAAWRAVLSLASRRYGLAKSLTGGLRHVRYPRVHSFAEPMKGFDQHQGLLSSQAFRFGRQLIELAHERVRRHCQFRPCRRIRQGPLPHPPGIYETTS